MSRDHSDNQHSLIDYLLSKTITVLPAVKLRQLEYKKTRGRIDGNLP
jgi:hypothetical protein